MMVQQFSYDAVPTMFLRALLAVVLGLMTLIGVPALVWSMATNSGPPLWFAIAWMAILAWNFYWWVFGLVVKLRVVGDVFEWQGVVRRGSVPLSNVVRLRPSGLGSGMEIVEMADGTHILVWVRRGFRAFCDALREVRPDVEVRIGSQGRLADGWPAWWTSGPGFRRRS